MTSHVTEILRATSGQGPRRVLLVDPSAGQAAEIAFMGGTIVQVRPSKRGARRLAGSRGSPAEGVVVVTVCADATALPFEGASFDTAACCAGLPEGLSVEELRRLVRVGGVVLVAGRVREGVAGGAASLVRRAARSGALPRASDLTACMLRAGLRPVRQASAKRALVPTVVTWAEVQARPWERPPPPREQETGE